VTGGVDGQELLSAVEQLRSVVSDATFPLDLPGVTKARSSQDALVKQLDDYVLPRLRSLDAPLLTVVGGSTGAGKSTLVNSVVGSAISPTGVLRPTTRRPVLVHNPQDEPWFTGTRILPGLARITGGDDAGGDKAGGDKERGDEAGSDDVGADRESSGARGAHSAVRLISSEALPPGLALLDAPDIDSVVHANRSLAAQLFLAADLWLFVTTAARYADAVPWDFLREAFEHGTSVAIVLDRVPPDAMEEVRDHLTFMLHEQGLASAPIFGVPETILTADGLLAEDDIARLRSWLSALALDAKARSIVVRRTLTGALRSMPDTVSTLSEASVEQETAVAALDHEVQAAYAEAVEEVEQGMTDGTLLRGEVLARWQEFVGTGQFLRQVEAGISRLRDRIFAAVKGDSPPTSELGEALQSGVAQLLTAQSRGARATVLRRWRQLPGGPTLVAAHPELADPPPESEGKVERLVRDWQGEVLDLVRAEAKDRRTTARVLSFGVNGVGVILMLVVFSHTGGLTGGEVGIAGGSAVLAQRILEAIFGDQAVRDLAEKARQKLLARTQDLYADEQRGLLEAITGAAVSTGQAGRIAAASAGVEAVAL
jgi:energy-coupling factor transporter ATP-binding protein EcfA2